MSEIIIENNDAAGSERNAEADAIVTEALEALTAEEPPEAIDSPEETAPDDSEEAEDGEEVEDGEGEEQEEKEPPAPPKWRVQQAKRYRDQARKALDELRDARTLHDRREQAIAAREQAIQEAESSTKELEQALRRSPVDAVRALSQLTGIAPAVFLAQVQEQLQTGKLPAQSSQTDPEVTELRKELQELREERKREREEAQQHQAQQLLSQTIDDAMERFSSIPDTPGAADAFPYLAKLLSDEQASKVARRALRQQLTNELARSQGPVSLDIVAETVNEYFSSMAPALGGLLQDDGRPDAQASNQPTGTGSPAKPAATRTRKRPKTVTGDDAAAVVRPLEMTQAQRDAEADRIVREALRD